MTQIKKIKEKSDEIKKIKNVKIDQELLELSKVSRNKACSKDSKISMTKNLNSFGRFSSGVTKFLLFQN